MLIVLLSDIARVGVPLDDLLVVHASQKDVALCWIRVELDAVGQLLVGEGLQTLARFRVPELHLSIETSRNKALAVVGKGNVSNGLGVAHEGSKAFSIVINVPQLSEERQRKQTERDFSSHLDARIHRSGEEQMPAVWK
jgi:hypothetical protein